MSQGAVDELVEAYRRGAPIRELSDQFGIHRHTVVGHLQRRAMRSTFVRRKLSDEQVGQASRFYAGGESLKAVGLRFGVDPATVLREFRKGGVPTRPRRGAVE